MKLDWNKLDAREKDAVVGKAIEHKPTIFTCVSGDGGKSMCGWVDAQHGPWYSRHDLVAWLAEQHANGQYEGYVIFDRDEWPRFTAEIQSAWLVVERMREMGFKFNLVEDCRGKFDCWFVNGKSTSVIQTSSSAPESICLAALRALGVEG